MQGGGLAAIVHLQRTQRLVLLLLDVPLALHLPLLLLPAQLPRQQTLHASLLLQLHSPQLLLPPLRFLLSASGRGGGQNADRGP